MSNFENMPKEQQLYIQLSAASKQLYQSRALSKDLQDLALSPDSDSLVVAQKANEIGRNVETGANQVYAILKGIEQEHPEFKTQAIEYAKSLSQEKHIKHEQSHGA